MTRGQLSRIVAIGTDQAQATLVAVKIMFAGEITVELVWRLQNPGAVTGEALCIYIDSSVAPGRCCLAAMATDVCAGECRRVKRKRSGFGIVGGGDRDIDRLIEVLQRTDPRSCVAGGTDSADETQGVMHPVAAGDVWEGSTCWRTAVAGGAILQSKGRTGQMAGRAGRADPADTVQIHSVAESTGNGQVGGVAMGNRAAPGDGIGWKYRRVSSFDVMAVLTAVNQRTDICPKARIAAGGARKRDRVAPLAEGQVFLGCRTVQGRIGKGDRMRSDSRKMAISMAGQTGKTCG